MKKFIQRVQDLSQKAAHLKQVVEAAPAQAAQLRDTVLTTAGQLQQMRHDVQSSVMGLRADNEDRLAQALREINDSTGTFEEAGYELTGVDMEVSPVQRLVVHLDKFDSPTEATLRELLAANSGRQTVFALLNALAKAEAISEKVALTHLTYRGLVVHVGPAPTIRLCWSSDAEEAELAPQATTSHAAPALAQQPTAPPPLPSFAQPGGMFDRRPSPPTPSSPTPTEQPAAPSIVITTSPKQPAAPVTSARAHGSDWKATALDRFKKMPDASKYRR